MQNFFTIPRATLGALIVVAVLAVTFAVVPQAEAAGNICCRDFGEGQLSELDNGRSFMRWNMAVEHQAVTLTVSGPCGVIQRRYDKGENPLFDLREVSPDDPNGIYSWELRIDPVIDPKVADMLADARGTGEEEEVFKSLRREGLLPEGPFIQSGHFEVVKGEIVDLGAGGEKERLRAEMPDGGEAAGPGTELGVIGAGSSAGGGISNVTGEAQVISGDLVVYNSLCVGFDCPTSPTFGADTIRLQENNLRIHVDDTSTASSFPNQDWRLEFNSNLNGGGEYFRVIDATAGRSIMTLEANAPSHSLYVDSGGRVGMGTQNPVLELHVVDGDTPALRLQQDTSSGFGAQTWDIAGNETSFFVRDATNGSTLPFRIFPGESSSALVIRNGGVGIGTTSPNGDLHIVRAGEARYRLENTSAGTQWDALNDGNGDFVISLVGTGGSDFEIEQSGEIGNCGNPDHDFVISTGPGCTATPRSWIDAGDTSFSITSSRTLKENLEPVQVADILEKIRKIPVYEFDFIQGPQDRIGLMAEDFNQIFGRGSETELSGHEVQVAMWLAIQKLDEKDAEIDALKDRIEALEQLTLGASTPER